MKEYSTGYTRAQGEKAFYEDPEARRDTPMQFRWKVPGFFRDYAALPWTGSPTRDHAMSCILAEAMAVAGTDQRVSVSLNRDWYTGREDLIGRGYTYEHVRGALRTLVQGGWLDIIKGERLPGGSGIQTVFWPTQRLIDLIGLDVALVYGLRDPIMVRGADGQPLPVPRSRELDRVRGRLEERNEAFAVTELSLDAPDITFTPGQPVLIDGRWYDPRKRAAHAVYNLSTRAGGRLYGLPYQTLNNRDHGRRGQLLQNGKPMEEPDFSGCHPRLIYHGLGLDPAMADLYAVRHPVYGRHEAKLAMQVLINATGERNGLEGFCYRLAGDAAKAERKAGGPILSQTELDARAMAHMPDARLLFEALSALHAPISRAFFTGIGVKLQHTETEIMTRAAMACLRRGVVVFPMHDSALTEAGEHASILREEMVRSYVGQVGKAPKIG